MLNFSTKTAIVTGASNGVGLSIAKLLCYAGANVVLADNNEVVLNEETLMLKQRGFKVIAFSGDLTKRLTLNNLLAATIDEFDKIFPKGISKSYCWSWDINTKVFCSHF